MPTEKEKCGKHECECQNASERETCRCKQQEEDKIQYQMGFDDGYFIGQFKFLETVQDVLNMSDKELLDCFGPLFPTAEQVLLEIPADIIIQKLQEWYEKKKEESLKDDEWAVDILINGFIDTVKLGTIHTAEALKDIGFEIEEMEIKLDSQGVFNGKVRYKTL